MMGTRSGILSSIVFPSPRNVDRVWTWPNADAAERLAAAFLLLVLLPALLLLAFFTFLLSGRSPWIAHRRVGRYGSVLWVPKLRTMWERRQQFPRLQDLLSIEYIDDEHGPGMKGPDDPRVKSRLARFCRQHSLDEVPQLILVVTGRMSLIGPRPVTPAELAEIYGPDAPEIVSVKPGISGLWQVS